MRNDENGAAMKKEDGCHKNKKTGQRTKRGKTRQKKAKELGQKGVKKGHKLRHTRAVQNEEKEW